MAKKPTASDSDDFELALEAAEEIAKAAAPIPAPPAEKSKAEIFLAAVKSEPESALIAKIKADPELAACVGPTGFDPLTTALLAKKPRFATALIDAGVPVDRKSTGMGWNPVVLSVQYPDVLSAILDKGASPNHKTHGGLYPLTVACTFNDKAALALLVSKGAELNPADSPWPPVVAAAAHDAALAFLKASGANLSQATPNGWTPLHAAAKAGNLTNVKLLAANGCSLNAQDSEGETPLHAAADAGQEAAFALLRELGADPTRENSHKKLPSELFKAGSDPRTSVEVAPEERKPFGSRPEPKAKAAKKPAAKKPTAKKTAAKTEAKPEVKAEAKKPAVKSDAKKPAVKADAKKPAAKKPVAKAPAPEAVEEAPAKAPAAKRKPKP